MTMVAPNRIVVVPDADRMDTETFALHMTFRHHDSLGGLKHLDERFMGDTEESWRTYHDRLHDLRVGLGHEHART